jgi:hypothetical protein
MDATTAARPTPSILLVVTGAFATDSVLIPPGSGPPTQVPVADDRPGTYMLDVTVAGYQTWTLTGILVRDGGRCKSVETRHINARLVSE